MSVAGNVEGEEEIIMTTEEMDQKICDWLNEHDETGEFRIVPAGIEQDLGSEIHEHRLFTESLDNCALFQDAMNEAEWLQYKNELEAICFATDEFFLWDDFYLRATAIDRCTAFLRAVGQGG